ncbi:Hint domain-containing protein, partial [Paracoccus sp. (in: a-proteobacteria)]|uniref:Hint domain-containing protein n=1 Tax=Paracoccus sp. TaxID=267 RepID=UPI003A8C1F2D
EYFHILFDRHEIVRANGTEAESLFTGPEAMKSLSPEARDEIRAIFPQLFDGSTECTPTPARMVPSGKQARKLAERSRMHGRDLQGHSGNA